MALDVTVTDADDGVNTTITDTDSGIDVTVGGNAGVEATIVSGGSGGSTGSSGSEWTQRTVTADTTAEIDESIWADGSSQSVTVTLPTAVQSAHVRVVAIDTTNDVAITGQGTTTISDHTGDMQTITMTDGESITVESDGSTWRIV